MDDNLLWEFGVREGANVSSHALLDHSNSPLNLSDAFGCRRSIQIHSGDMITHLFELVVHSYCLDVKTCAGIDTNDAIEEVTQLGSRSLGGMLNGD